MNFWTCFDRSKLILVVLSFGIISTISLSTCNWDPLLQKDERRITLARAQLAVFEKALERLKSDTNQYPGNQDGLTALVENASGGEKWAGPYLPKIPLDPWGRSYVYNYAPGRGAGPVVLCLGADGRPGGSGEDTDLSIELGQSSQAVRRVDAADGR